MNSLTARLGFWSSVVGMLSFIVYIFSFVAIMVINPVFSWTNLNSFIEYNNNYNQFYKYLAMWFMLIFGISYVVQVVCLGEYADKPKQVFAKLAALFGTGFALLIGINYFIQLTAVRLQLEAGQGQDLAQFVMSYPVSAVAAINMLGWTVFFGVSSIFAALCLGDTKTEKACRRSLLANGIVMLIGCIGYAANSVGVVFLCMYIGLGATVFASSISQCLLYKNEVWPLLLKKDNVF